MNRARWRSPIPAAMTAALVSLALVFGASGCTSTRQAVPTCGSVDRLVLVAQSVPTASYVPCLRALPAGWTAGRFAAASGHTRFTLTSDRAGGSPVRVDLRPACDVTGATAAPPRDAGVRTYTRLRSISPRYAGTLLDVFAGGCVSYQFDFQRGPHIPLMEEFEAAIGFYSRRQLALDLRRRLGVSLNP
jgi:hypothetical protein